MLHNEEFVNRKALLASATGEKSEFITSEGDTIICVYSVINYSDNDFMSSIFKHLLAFPDTPLKLRLMHPTIYGKCKGSLLTIDAHNIRDNDEIITNKKLIINYFILRKFMSVAADYCIPINYSLLSQAIQKICYKYFIEKKLNPKIIIGSRVYKLTKLILFIYRKNECDNMLAENFQGLLPILPNSQGLLILKSKLQPTKLKALLLKYNKQPEPLLHLFLKACHYNYQNIPTSDIEFILSCLDHQPTVLLDSEGNNLLHVCRMFYYFEFLLKFVENINQRNAFGNTALHIAARDSDFIKFKFLLKNGADPTLKNNDGKEALELALECPPDQASQLYLYATHALRGKALSSIPEISTQRGQTCGIYAAECATLFHRNNYPKLFTRPHCKARKDGEKNIPSLRNTAKQLGSFIGEIFSDQTLSRLVELNECYTIISPVNNYAAFIEIIKKSLALDLPVIIPYSNNLEEHQNPKAFNAHWATIIGYHENKSTQQEEILLAHYGNYQSVEAQKLFACFNLMEDNFPLCYLFKKPKDQWNKVLQEPEGTGIKKIKFQELDLRIGYKNRLITVCPPGFDKNTFETSTLETDPMSLRGALFATRQSSP